MELKKYANSKGVEIIGDMPAYPVFNSAETNYHLECFQTENGAFTYEAGAPPDMFNEEGQTWGNPVYNVDNLRKDNYKYLINRYKYYSKLFKHSTTIFTSSSVIQGLIGKLNSSSAKRSVIGNDNIGTFQEAFL